MTRRVEPGSWLVNTVLGHRLQRREVGQDRVAHPPSVAVTSKAPAASSVLDCFAQPLPLQGAEIREHLVGKAQPVELLESAARVLDRVQRDEKVPDLPITVHEADGRDAGLRFASVEPVPNVDGVKLVFFRKQSELPHDVLENPRAPGAAPHGPPAMRVLVREALESQGLVPKLSRGGRVTLCLLHPCERETIPSQVSETQLGAAKLKSLHAITESGDKGQCGSDRDQGRTPAPVAGREDSRHSSGEHRGAGNTDCQPKQWANVLLPASSHEDS